MTNIASLALKYFTNHAVLIFGKQEPGEGISAYITELRVIAKNCAHDEVILDEILRDCLVLGVQEEKN